MAEPVDALVIGAGFGGLGAALTLAERGRSVVLCETLNYPGGCASTFERDGFRFEAGATLFSGFDPHQLFGRWIARHGLDIQVDLPDPVVELRTPEGTLPVGRGREELLARLCAQPNAPRRELERFFAYQRRVARTLWEVLDEPDLLPPLGPAALARHVARVPRYLPLLRLVGRPLSRVLERFGLADFQPLRTVLQALCQITVQCRLEEAESPFALACMDYYYRGTGHVRHGIGRLASELVRAVEELGGDVRMATRVRGLRRAEGGWIAETRRGTVRARCVLANVLPHDLERLHGAPFPRLARTRDRVSSGWGACMLYRVVAPPAGADEPRHLELVQDTAQPFTEGNHLFASVSGPRDADRAPGGLRTMTVSTHVALDALRDLRAEERAEHIAGVQARMRRGLAALAPEWEDVRHELPASPRTFERFTGRHLGLVGGIPRRASLTHYTQLGPLRVAPGLWLVGDSAFPGQSTLATATGGARAAEAADRLLAAPRRLSAPRRNPDRAAGLHGT